MTRRINDVDTAIETDHPAAWTTPADGGKNLVTEYEHDDRVVVETNPLDERRTLEHDATGELSVRTDRNGRVIEFDYDAAGRLTEERWIEGNSTVNALQFTYDPNGRLLTAGDNQSNYAYAYDLLGRPARITQTDGSPSSSSAFGEARPILFRCNQMRTLFWESIRVGDNYLAEGYDAEQEMVDKKMGTTSMLCCLQCCDRSPPNLPILAKDLRSSPTACCPEARENPEC